MSDRYKTFVDLKWNDRFEIINLSSFFFFLWKTLNTYLPNNMDILQVCFCINTYDFFIWIGFMNQELCFFV